MMADAPHFESNGIQGYEQAGVGVVTPLKNPIAQTQVVADTSEQRGEFLNVPLLSEDEAKEALVQYVSSNCCYGTKPLKEMKFTDLQSSNTYRYVLETFTEFRSTQWAIQPYQGQTIYNNGMPPPQPWDIISQPKSLFQNETALIEVPNTAYVKSCDSCNGVGNRVCPCCNGLGRGRCGNCHGSGSVTVGIQNPGFDNSGHVDVNGAGHVDVNGTGHVDVNGHHHHHHHHDDAQRQPCPCCNGSGSSCCVECNSSGRIQCPTCLGSGRVKMFIQLNVTYENHQDDYIRKSENIPDDNLRNCQAQCTFSEQNPRVYAITHHTCQEVNKASYDLILGHLNRFQSHRIIVQRHSVNAIPVTLCKYNFNNEEYTYHVFGQDRQVFTTDYPQTCCCGCSIL